jgi:hypothetical protein
MPALVPQVGGVLEATPFARVLAHALDCRFGGTLVLEESGGYRHGIQFESGIPRKAKTGCPVAYLGEVLVETGALSPAAYRGTLERAQSEKLLHGRILLAERILSERELGLGLREQLARQVAWMFGRPGDTRFGFFPDTNLLEHWGASAAVQVDPLELIWRGLRDHASPRDLERALAEIGDRPLVLREDLPLDYFFFLGSDRALIDRLVQGSLGLGHDPALSDERVTRVLCLLTLTRALELGTRSSPPLGLEANAIAPLSIPPPAAVPDLGQPSERSPHSAPPTSAPPHSAPPTSAPPPNSLPSDTAELLDSAPPLASHRPSSIPDVVAANLHLKQLVRRRASRPDAQEAERAHAAMTAFARAEALVAHGNFAAAKREIAAALEFDPQPPYLAMSAWLASQEPNPDLRSIARELERAYRLAEGHPSVRFYRGLVMQRLGKHATALRDFRFVLEKLPRHIDAMRQVRIYEARLRQSPKDRPSLAPADPAERPRSGLFGWFRKAKP